MNCNESLNTNDPAEKHHFTLPENHQFILQADNPEKNKKSLCGYIHIHDCTDVFCCPDSYCFHHFCVVKGDACSTHAKWNAHGYDAYIY